MYVWLVVEPGSARTTPAKRTPVKNRILLLIVGACCLPATAYAYVDPGSGMLLWQGLIAAIGAVLVFVRNPWETIKRLVQRLRGK